MATLREFEQALQSDPTLTEPFLALRKAYREAGTWDKLITLYELRAQALTDGPKAGELFYLAAEVRLDHLDDAEGAEADLAHAIDRDPDNIKAARRLKLLYRQQGRPTEYMTMLEVEAAAVGRTKDPAHITELDTELGQFCRESLAKLERAVSLPAAQRQAEVTPEGLKLVESARKIYRALGDYRSVVNLYELELALTVDAKRRSDLLLGLGRVLSERLGDLESAAQRLGEVVRLRPRDDKALEALAAVYANPRWMGADGKDRAAATYYQVARRRHEAGDVDNAVAALRKALAVVPGHAESSELLEQALYGAGRLADLDLYYRERVAEATVLEEKMDFLFKRAQLAEGDRRDSDEALRIYQEIAGIEPAGGPASQRLVELYTASQDYARLAELREKQLEQSPDPAFRLALLTELGALYRDRLGDPEQAAVYWHAILQDDPGNPDALTAYADHFRQRGDWASLVDLLEFSFDHARAAGHAVSELLERLEEIAVISERNLGDSERALSAWQRMDELSPGHDRAREAQKRILQKGQQWDRMVAVLEREAETAADPAQKVDTLRRLARVLLEKLAAGDRASIVYSQILALEPKDPVALRALVELYERDEKWADLAVLLRGQLEGATSKPERLATLRRLLGLYHERLDALADGSWAAAEILKIQPGDREALDRLEAILERSDDKRRLVETLEYHIKYAGTAEEKLRLSLRIADLLRNDIGDAEGALHWWEEVLRLAPGDATALDALAEGYERLGRQGELARVLELQIDQAGADATARAEGLRRLARMAEGVLADQPRAQRAWEELLRALPDDAEALERLSVSSRDRGDWHTLVGLLERRIPLAGDAAVAVELALERARVFEEELRIRGEAIAALEQIVEQLDPRCRPAFDRLRRLAEAGGDWNRVVAVAEKQLFLEEDPHEKAVRSLQIGELWRDRLNDPRRAMQAFERAVEIDPHGRPGLTALAALYADAGEWQRLILTDEKLLEMAGEDADERRRLMFEIAATAEARVGDPRLAFEWYRRAYNETADDEALARLEAAAETHGLWDDLVQVYDGARARATEPAGQVAISLKIAKLVEEAIGDPARALGVLREALTSEPDGQTLLPEIERLAASAGDWNGLLEVYAQVARSRPETADRLELLRRRAQVREARLGDASGALDEELRAFALAPDEAAARTEITRLAELTGRWEDALTVEAQRFTRAVDVPSKVEIAARAAALMEEKVHDRLRAFRAYLNAFRLAPENETVVAHLWRLARLLEESRPAEPAAALPAEEAPEDLSEELHELMEEVEEGDEVTESSPPPPPELLNRPPTPGPTRAPAVPVPEPWAELAQAYEVLPAADSAARHQHLRKVAEIWERGANQIERALRTLERAFGLEPGDEAVRADLRRIASQHGRWEEVCRILERAAESAPRDEAVKLHHEVAQYREQLGHRAAAEAAYQKILLLKPEDSVALDREEDLLRHQERWAELASLLEKRTAGTLEALPPGTLRRKRTAELAELHDQRLERPYEAIDTYERYLASADEDDRGPDHPDVVHGNCDALEALARLYGKVGMWPKAAQALQREIDLIGEPARLRDLRWRLAEIYEKELGETDQSVATYEAMLQARPDDDEALAALDRLLEAQAHYEPLQDVLRRRAELAIGPARAELIRRRARLLEERLDNPDAAAACLRALGPDAFRDDETAEALLRNLGRAGLAHEALRLYAQRIELLSGEQAAPERLATLHLEAAALRLDRLDDPAGARQSIDKALGLVPDSPAALSALARLHLRANDFAAYAATLAREAEARRQAGEGPAAAEAWIEVGRVSRDQLARPAEARHAFERAAEADPQNPEALRALAALLVGEGQTTEARALFERQLELVEDPAQKAAVLTDLARSLWERPGDPALAIARLDQALDLAPDYLPAVVTMADIYYREQQWAEAERRLLQAIRRSKGQPGDVAQLYHRLGEVYEKLGRLDDGHRHLLEADRIAPNQLLIRLALGENRFQAKKWREAAAHLEGIDEHPDAHRYPLEVAEGLAHAAQSEVRLKRPERAVVLYQAALRASPDHRPSLRALVDLALERGEPEVAIQHLRTLAEGSGDRAERSRLFEELGDLLKASGADVAARTAYEEAVGLLGEATTAHVPLLDKALALQRAAGAAKEAAETSQRLIALSSDPKERAVRRREAALLLEAQGEHGQAGEFLEQALAESPNDETVLASVVVAYERAKRKGELEAVLATTLPALPPVGGDLKARARRAELWEKLGELRRRRDKDGAITALETAVAIESERVSARALLAKLYGDREEHAAAALTNHRLLVMADLSRGESLRKLALSYADQGRVDWARCCFEAMQLLGLSNKDDRAFLAAHVPPARKPEDPYAASLEDADRVKYLAHPQARVMAEVFATIWEGVPPAGGASLESLGLTPLDKVSPISDVVVAQIFGQVAKALGNRRASLYVNPRPEFEGVTLVLPPPPAVVVGARAVDGEPGELRFRLGRALELARPEYLLGAGLGGREFAQLFTGVLKAFHPRHARWRAGAQDAATEQAAKLKKALPYKVAKRLAELFQEHETQPWSSSHWRAAVLETGNRAGLVMCGDLATAARIVLADSGVTGEPDADVFLVHAGKPGPLRELIRYAISEEYFALRETLGTSVPRAVAA